MSMLKRNLVRILSVYKGSNLNMTIKIFQGQKLKHFQVCYAGLYMTKILKLSHAEYHYHPNISPGLFLFL